MALVSWLRRTTVTALLVGLLGAGPAFGQESEAVAEWIVALDRMSAPASDTREQSVLQMAMHDALNLAVPRYGLWMKMPGLTPRAGAVSAEAALHGAAHFVLLRLHPDWSGMLDRLLHQALLDLPEGEARLRGIALGRSVAVAHLARLKGDVRAEATPFTASAEIGRWRPTPPDDAPGTLAWQGRARPVALENAGAVPLEPPAVADPAVLARDLAEVKARGDAAGAGRSPEETEVAQYWARHHALHLWPRTVAALAESDPPGDLWRTVFVLSVVQAVLHDATVATFAAKELLGVARPVTAIREGWVAGLGDPDWEAMLPTPAHPEFPAGHGVLCSAAVAAIEAFWRFPPQPFELWTETGGIAAVRSFAEPRDAALECAEARVLVGAHYRSTMEVSGRFGRAVAAAVLARAPRPLGQSR